MTLKNFNWILDKAIQAEGAPKCKCCGKGYGPTTVKSGLCFSCFSQGDKMGWLELQVEMRQTEMRLLSNIKE